MQRTCAARKGNILSSQPQSTGERQVVILCFEIAVPLFRLPLILISNHKTSSHSSTAGCGQRLRAHLAWSSWSEFWTIDRLLLNCHHESVKICCSSPPLTHAYQYCGPLCSMLVISLFLLHCFSVAADVINHFIWVEIACFILNGSQTFGLIIRGDNRR